MPDVEALTLDLIALERRFADRRLTRAALASLLGGRGFSTLHSWRTTPSVDAPALLRLVIELSNATREPPSTILRRVYGTHEATAAAS